MRIINAKTQIFFKEIFDSYKSLNPLSFFENFQEFPVASDRFGVLNKYSTFNLYATKGIDYLNDLKSKSFDNSQKFLSDAIDKRGKYLLDKAYQNKKDIYLLWSGGIDSTAVFISFLKNIKNNEILHIVMSKNSIDEYKSFFEQYVIGKFDIILTNKNNYDNIYELPHH